MALRSIDYDKCNDCGICFDICPMDCFRSVGPKVYVAYPEDCMTCHLCTMHCRQDAIFVGPERARRIPTCS